VLDELVDWCATHAVTSVPELTGALDVSPRPPA
jgi:hypothetical protein